MSMIAVAPLTQGEVQELVHAWFRMITDHADVADMEAMLSADDLEMVFPERTLRNLEDFRDWYSGVTREFFDQIHDVRMLAVDLDGGAAGVTLIVNWQARTWTPPAAYSDWQGAFVHQTWRIERDARSGKARITRYVVGAFEPMRGRP